MSTFGTMKSRIAREMKRGELSASSSAVQDSILSAIEYFKRKRFYFNEFNDVTAPSSASQTYMSLSSFGIRPILLDSVKGVIGNRDYPLTAKTWQAIDSIDAGQWYGFPEWYSIHTEKLRLYPPPNNAYVVRIAGIKDLTEVSASATSNATNPWVDDAEQMIRCQAKGYLFRDALRNVALGQQFRADANDSFRELSKETRAKTPVGRLRKTNW